MKTKLNEKRWQHIQNVSLKSGPHAPDSEFCVMEAAAYVAGEKWNDAPECVCPVISTLLRAWNDALPTDAERDALLKPLIPFVINTKDETLEQRRALMAMDWFVRVQTPAWLRLAGLTSQADSLECLPEITDITQVPSVIAAQDSLAEVEVEVDTWDAPMVQTVARDAARECGADAARVAARYTWSADSAWTLAWLYRVDVAQPAMCHVAAQSSSWDAAVKKLAPTRDLLQKSAVELVKRMCTVRA